MSVDLEQARLLAEALAIGLLVGVERYKARGPGEKGPAGVRTFAAFALLGGVSGLLGQVGFTLAAFAAVAVLVAIAYYRQPGTNLGLTTEVASLLVFWLAVLVFHHEVLAIATAIVLTIGLAAKSAMHAFVKQSMTETEFYDTLKFLAVVLVVYPLLPDRSPGSFDFLNPSRLWLLVVLVSTISYAGYLATRILGPRRGLTVSALVGGVVSSTATTVSLAGRARQRPEASRRLGVAAVAANAVQPLRLLVLLWVVNEAFSRAVTLPLAAMSLAGVAGAWLLSRRARDELEVALPFTNPYSLTPAVKFALFFVAILFATDAAEALLGSSGVLLASALGGAASVSAVALTLAQLVSGGSLALAPATGALLLAIAVNALAKWVLAASQGTGVLAAWLGGGLLTMLAAAGVVFALLPG